MSVTTGSTSQEAAPGVTLSSRYLTVPIDGTPRHFHYVWLRDNCWCTQCKVAQSGERRLFTADIPSDIQPTDAQLDNDQQLTIEWTDGHSSTYSAHWLRTYDYSAPARQARRHEPTLWTASMGPVPTFEHASVVGTTEGQLADRDARRHRGGVGSGSGR